jgi:alkylation response protein AidB-like acyl-CoA dehydrogenase
MPGIDMEKVNMDLFGETNPFGDPGWYQGMNSPYYNDSHKAWRAMIRKFVDENIMDQCTEWDEHKEIPQDVLVAFAATGVLGCMVGHPWPEKYCPIPKLEGIDSYTPDYFHELIMVDESSRCGSGGFMWGVAGGFAIGFPPVYQNGSQEMLDRVAPGIMSGKERICLAITEPTAGSDVANIRCKAEKKDDFYIVNGEKKWITNGIWCEYFSTAVRTGGPGIKGISMMLIERKHGGVETRRMDCSGVWSSGTTFVTFSDVKVPATNLIGKEGKGFKYIMKNFNHERFLICGMTNRFSRVCFEESLKFANKRKTFGKKLVDHPVIRWKLAEMARQIEANHAWLEVVAHQMNTMQPLEAFVKLGGSTALLKVQCTKVFEYCAREGAQIFGGLGYTRGGQGAKVERLAREVRAMAVPGGSEEIMLDLGIRQQRKVAEMAQQFVGGKAKL